MLADQTFPMVLVVGVEGGELDGEVVGAGHQGALGA